VVPADPSFQSKEKKEEKKEGEMKKTGNCHTRCSPRPKPEILLGGSSLENHRPLGLQTGIEYKP
jgi:hypothetical protein